MSSTLSGISTAATAIADHDLVYLDFDTSGTGAGPWTDKKIAGSDLKTVMAAQAPVQSVAGRTGTVVLTAADVGARPRLTANTTIWWGGDNSTGSDTTGDGSNGNPFKTIAKAWNYMATLDNSGFTVTIKAKNSGTAPSLSVGIGGNATGGPFGGGQVIIEGKDNTDATQTVLTATSAQDNMVFAQAFSDTVTVQWLTLDGGTTPVFLLDVGVPIRLFLGGTVIFGAATTAAIIAQGGNIGLLAGTNLSFKNGASYSVGCLYVANNAAIGAFGSSSFNSMGTVTVGSGFAVASVGGVMLTSSCSHSGTFSGPRYRVETNGVIDTFGSGASYFPGSSVGSDDGHGMYV